MTSHVGKTYRASVPYMVAYMHSAEKVFVAPEQLPFLRSWLHGESFPVVHMVADIDEFDAVAANESHDARGSCLDASNPGNEAA